MKRSFGARAARPYLCIAAAALVVALLLFSNLFSLFDARAYPAAALPATAEQGFLVQNGKAHVPATGGACSYTLNQPTRNLFLRVSAPGVPYSLGLHGKVELQDAANKPSYAVAGEFYVSATGTENSALVPLRSNGNAASVRITFDAPGTPVVVEQLLVNQPQKFRFSVVKALLLFLVGAAVYYCAQNRRYLRRFDWRNSTHRLALGVDLLICLLVALVFFVCCLGGEGALLAYPSASVSDGQQYLRQFDAWMHGQTQMLQQPSPALAALDNPYNPHLRDAAEISYLWDFAYYQGRYYSYFGVTPLLLVYLPVYLLTGQLPTDITVCTVLALVAVLFLFGLVKELLLCFHIQPNLLMYLLAMPALCFGGMLYFLQAEARVYNIATLSGQAFLMVALCLSFRAARAKRAAARTLCFALAGLAFALLLGSRPNLMLPAVLFVAPLFISILFSRARKLRFRLRDAGAFLLPALTACALLLYYNYIRFGSFTEFGARYQLTVCDVSYSKLYFSPQALGATLLSYFFMPLDLQGSFPYVALPRASLHNMGNYVYNNEPTLALFSIPAAWLLCCGWRAFREKGQALKKATWLCGLAGACLTAYLDFCVGGVLYRYACDFILLFLLLAVLFALDAFSGEKQPSGGARLLACGILAATVALGFLLSFAQPHGLAMRYPDTAVRLARFFSLGLV